MKIDYEVIKETAKTITVKVTKCTYSDRGRNPVSGWRCGDPTDYDLVAGTLVINHPNRKPTTGHMMTKFLKEDRDRARWNISAGLGLGVITTNEFGGSSLTHFTKKVYIKWEK